MGAAGSRSLEADENYKVFSDREREQLITLFEKLTSSGNPDNKVFEYDAFKDHMAWLFPEDIISRLFKEMCHFQQSLNFLKEPEDPTKVGKRAFFRAVSHCVKQANEKNGHVFYILSADPDQIVTSVEMEDLCLCLLNSYAAALKHTVHIGGSQWKLETDRTVNQLFAKMAVKELLGNKENPSCVSPSDVKNWFAKFPLIQHIFVATMRACFFGAEDLIEVVHHGLSEGCEETIEHIQYDRSHILLPCKLDIDFSKCSTLLNIPSIITINHHLPATLRHRWRLLFSTQTHGESFQAFVHQIVNQGPTVLVIQDCDGHVFGGFASKSWAIKSHFDGDSNCFLFSLSPTLAVYHPTGYNENFMYLNMGTQTMPNGLGMGGQLEYFGLWLDHNFGPGHSCAQPTCTTYGSAQLSAQQKFQLNSVEVWGVGVPPEVELEKRSVLDAEVEAKAFLEIAGKEIHSEGLREQQED